MAISKEQIAKIAYDLYVEEWLREHISTERLLAARRDFYLAKLTEDYDEKYDFDAYLLDVGFDGELYACYDDFFDYEFEDKAYMHGLLKLPELTKAYDEHMGNSLSDKEWDNVCRAYNGLNPKERDGLYRRLWKDYVIEDINAFIADGVFCFDTEPTQEDIDFAADLYVNGEYDCTKDYWTNIENVLNRAMGGVC